MLCHPSSKSPVEFLRGRSLDPYYSPYTCVIFQGKLFTVVLVSLLAVHAASSSILEIEHRLNDDLGQTARWLRSKKLHINAIKTQVVLFGSRCALSKNPELNISLEGGRLQQVNCVKYLGVMLDNILSWNAHVDHLQRKTNRIVKMLRRLRYTVPSCVIQNIYTAIVLPSMDYCDV